MSASISDAKGREAVLRAVTKSMPVEPDIPFHRMALCTENMSPAELSNICREAAMNALREDVTASVIRISHFEAALSTQGRLML